MERRIVHPMNRNAAHEARLAMLITAALGGLFLIAASFII
jgi:heme/copper-type cytochrome/quinol oxidase subunit 3